MTRLMFALVTTGLLFTSALTSLAQAADSILIEFSSDHCPPCQAMKPVLAELERIGVPVRHVDVDSEPSVALRYGIRKTPTFIVVSAGKEVTRMVGMQTIEELQTALATSPSGPLFATGAVQQSLTDIPAPQTRLAPMGMSASSASGLNETLVNALPSTPEPRSEAMPSMSIADAVQRAEAATVRLRVHEGNGYGAGTGTIIDTHGEDALVLTCGHLFRENQGKGKVEVDLFVGGQTRTVIGEVIDFDAENRDIALVAIRPGFQVQPINVIGHGETPRNGQTVFSFGCDRGDDPSRRDTRVTGVNKYNQHLGASNIEIDGAPIDGRSGGGLFDEEGRLVGVCNAADYKNDVGIYTGPGSVHWQLDRVNLSHLYQSKQRGDLVAPTQAVESSPIAALPAPAERIAALETPSQGFASASPSEPLGGPDQEVIVIVRDRNNPAATSQVMTLSEPSTDLMQMIQRHAR